MKFRFRHTRVLAAALSFPLLSASSLTTNVTPDHRACKAFNLPRWKGPAGTGKDWMMAMSCDLDFRALNQNFAVGAHCARSPQAEQIYSADKYVVDWETGRTRKASEEEWNHADALLTSRAAPRDTKFEKWGHRFTYEGKQFHIAGGLEYLNGTNTLRLSPDGSRLVVNSWDGKISCPEDAWIWNCHINGRYYVEFYGVASGQRALLITGEFHGVEPFGMFDQGGWLSRQYYVIPQDVGRGLRHFLLCALPHRFNAATDDSKEKDGKP